MAENSSNISISKISSSFIEEPMERTPIINSFFSRFRRMLTIKRLVIIITIPALIFCFFFHLPSFIPLTATFKNLFPVSLSFFTKTSASSNLTELEYRLNLTRRLTTEAWTAYLADAKGDEALRPDSGEPLERPPLPSGAREFRSGLTAIEAASTFLVMGLEKEFAEVKAYLAHSFHVRRVEVLCVPVAITRYIGSLVSLHYLTNGGDESSGSENENDQSLFLEKAFEVARLIRPAFQLNSTALPAHCISLKRADGGRSVSGAYEPPVLEEIGSMHLELIALSSLLKESSQENSTFWSTAAYRIRDTLLTQQKSSNNGLFRRLVSPARDLIADRYSVDEGVSGFLGTLIKSYIASAGSDTTALTAYLQAVNSAVKGGLIVTVEQTEFKNNFSFAYSVQKKVVVTGVTSSHHSPSSSPMSPVEEENTDAQTMKFAGCHLGAIFGLSGLASVKKGATAVDLNSSFSSFNSIRSRQHAHRLKGNLLLAERFLETCTAAGRLTPSGMTPARMEFIQSSPGDAEKLVVQEHFKEAIPLTPEMAEAVFVLSRSTDDPAPYQEIAWSMVQALDRSSPSGLRGKVGGFASWIDPKDSALRGGSTPRDLQPATFIGATLKYLYLTLLPVEKDDKKTSFKKRIFNKPLPLTKWVFNAVGQPFPICGQHRLYAKCPERK